MRVLRFFSERLLYKSWVVSSSCIDFVLFSHSEAFTFYGGRLETNLYICIMFLFFFCCTVWYRILCNNWNSSSSWKEKMKNYDKWKKNLFGKGLIKKIEIHHTWLKFWKRRDKYGFLIEIKFSYLIEKKNSCGIQKSLIFID